MAAAWSMSTWTIQHYESKGGVARYTVYCGSWKGSVRLFLCSFSLFFLNVSFLYAVSLAETMSLSLSTEWRV
jgi:hypothetical protein